MLRGDKSGYSPKQKKDKTNILKKVMRKGVRLSKKRKNGHGQLSIKRSVTLKNQKVRRLRPSAALPKKEKKQPNQGLLSTQLLRVVSPLLKQLLLAKSVNKRSSKKQKNSLKNCTTVCSGQACFNSVVWLLFSNQQGL
jgi:hypothetical protein